MNPILEQIQLGDRQSISAFEYCSEHFQTPWHFHPQNELTYIVDSVGTKFIGDYVGAYEPGELVLLRSDLPHCWKNQASPHRLARSIVVQWNRAILPEIPEFNAVFELMANASRGLIFYAKDVKAVLPSLSKLPATTGPDLYIKLLAILTQLAQFKFRYLSAASFEQLPDGFSSRMAKVHEFIEQHYARKIYLHELSLVVNMSEQSFSRFFSKMMGRPFFTFLNEYRINAASRLLIDTEKSISEIGYCCGYDSLSFFHKQFKKFKGSTPSRYRTKYQNNKYSSGML